MQRCLELAQQAAGQTAPNPMVGSVIVQAGQPVGEGFHPGAGHPHAEVFAIQAAGDRTLGSTLYVNLEPCNHFGRTPPCTETVIQAGIHQVVVGMIDPDSRVAGSGVQRLREAGIEVIVGVEEAACQKLNEAFVHRVTQHAPLGILKYAMTLDGKIATTTGHSTWVTGPEARATVHRLRSTCDAVIVGGNTVRRDNPHLTTHGQSTHTPLRVVMSRALNLPTTAHLWQTEQAPTLVFTSEKASPQQQDALTHQGVEVLVLPDLKPRAVMAELYQRGCAAVLWECGGTLAAHAIADRSVQKVWAFIAPKIIGGVLAPSPVGNLHLHEMTDAIALQHLKWRAVGPDLLVEGYLNWPEPDYTS
ncbi:bifunctional diaminohydroxyphosphoribosylaminopyrimidine deaminase/5-amino-6-(5-phosphoribosylamino)uracil reductase RibD [Pseudanabaena sp. FACHB-2040]|uniref:bifunctional diaminohydroxyphosphoribosylaminopyrimidine deaminase/5-amino-6-(5-phosphoribosylamino)uracil reductase RibD n=1 Tax=Pseudanabaena sp. FACHB-2040 TaxID=2692859 RepID=UPI001682A514|nr:bifunctional diaminohydroxyphosphoribosylaminopyrimidine deaminase/5-amino-6-(5-phosphoribosylamino)uracil reductase RibD [Pseudanabaena sp. FACHB-2040]MBD2256235.1 bifunctional diaminohydroxyphosphoribosylaminopyrimidine deaminase/5-amino-6-(5-phosphoribosylamino)uracil reductase RibD [Pseudanabaena sp. FACHB-2040]